MIRANKLIVNNLLISNTPLMRDLNQFETFELEPPVKSARGFVRHSLVSKNIMGQKSIRMFLPEIDTIVFRYHSQNSEGLFTRLMEFGYETPLVKHFASFGEDPIEFHSPHSFDLLLKKKTYASKKDPEVYYRHYYLGEGGFIIFQAINNIDPTFWPTLITAAQNETWLELFEVHLNADFDTNLMPQVASNLVNGYYETNGCRPQVFGRFSETLEKKYLTKRGAEFQQLKEIDLTAQTVYFGNRYTMPQTVVFYDKEHEQLTRRNDLSAIKTRVETRLYNRKQDEFFLQEMLFIVLNYNTNEGIGRRGELFCDTLKSVVMFTNRYETKSLSVSTLAPWFVNCLLIPLTHINSILKAYDNVIESELLNKGISQNMLLPETTGKRKRGRPKGKKDSKPRKRREPFQKL